MKHMKMILFLLILSSICTVILGGAQLAYEKASVIFNKRLYVTILELFDVSAGEDNVEKIFQDYFDTKTIGTTNYYIAKKKKKGARVFKAEGPGLWSRIEVLLAVEQGAERLHALHVLSQAETPGLGGRIAEPAFQKRFNGVEIRPEVNIVKFAAKPNEVDAIAGASKTGDALERIINRAVASMDGAFNERKSHNE